MDWNVFQWRSLKTRVTLSTLAIFLVGIWSLAFYASQELRADMQVLLSEQQLASVSAVAADVDNELDQRFRALANLASLMEPTPPSQWTVLQTLLKTRPVMVALFNGGFIAYRRDGSLVQADGPHAEHLDPAVVDANAVAAALEHGKASVGQPRLEPNLHLAVFAMVVPVRDAQGEVVGAVAGLTNVSTRNFLDRITDNRYARTGSYLIITPESHQIVMASDKSRILEVLPARGGDPLTESIVQGREGFQLTEDADGKEMLLSSMPSRLSGWRISAVLSSTHAFAPVYTMQKHMLLATVLLTLLVGGLTWWMLSRQLAPMMAAVATLARLADPTQRLQPLAIQSQDEVGQLIGGFNRLLEALAQREQAQRESEERFRTLVEWSPEAAVVHVNGKIRYVNPAAVAVFGASAASDLVGTSIMDRMHTDSLELARERAQYVADSGYSVEMVALQCLRLDGTVIDVEAQGTLIMFDGESAVHTVLRDISGRKRAEAELRIAATAFESQQGMLVADGNWTILRVNRAFTELTGYTSEDVVGHSPLELLRSEHHTQKYFDEITALVARNGTWEGEIWDRHKNGKVFPQWVSITAVKDVAGHITHYVDTMTDITQRKLADEEQRIAATAFESQQGLLVTDDHWTILRVNRAFTHITGYTVEEAVGSTPEQLLRSGTHSADFFEAMLDTLARTDTWQGEICNRCKDGRLVQHAISITAVKDAAGKLTHYVHSITDITERKRAEEQIQNLAFYDPLTQLPNRRLLMDRLAHAMANWSRHKRLGALLFVDLDNFKILNDTFGHHKGDLLLQAVASRLSTCIRKGDTVARLGGDEFVVMLEDLSDDPLDAATQAEIVGEKVLAALNQGYLLADHAHHSTPSIGITLFGAPHEAIEEPLKRADMAMYQAKAAGRNTLRFFDPHMQSEVSARAALEAGMRKALERQEFLLHYQAQVVDRGECTGVEVLVRWNHPERGLVSPAEFIPMAEETGMILPLGLWVLETACNQLARWAQQPDMAHLTVAVNVSPRQFYQSNFVDQVLDVLRRTGAPPKLLKLELTEGLLVSNVEDVIAKMESLQAEGVGFSLDDFGTGYSSLSHLKRLPLDQLKIDQSFVRDILTDPNDAAIANMVIVLANSLGLAVIAEGVETEAQREVLAAQGCHAYQGYLFSRPLPLEGFEALVRGGALVAI